MPPPPMGAWRYGKVDIVEPVQKIFQEYSSFKESCKKWAEKLHPASTGEGLSTVIEGLRRMISGVVIKKGTRQWTGWTDKVIAEDKKRYETADEVQEMFGHEQRSRRQTRKDLKQLLLDTNASMGFGLFSSASSDESSSVGPEGTDESESDNGFESEDGMESSNEV